ncbi:YggT family protein [Chloroflexota bacterium]
MQQHNGLSVHGNTALSIPIVVVGYQILLLLRRTMPSLGGLDFSPLVAIIVLYFIPSLFRWLVLLCRLAPLSPESNNQM